MFIVLEGLDGAGKSTQVKKLKSYLETLGAPLSYIRFPRYDALVYGNLISRFLRDDFGDIAAVHPQLSVRYRNSALHQTQMSGEIPFI